MKIGIGPAVLVVALPFACGIGGVLGCSADASAPHLGETSADLSTPATLDVDFTDCHDYAGLAPVPIANVAAYVPAPYQIAQGAPGIANVVVRSVWCRTSSIDPRPGVVSQIGVNIVSPDGTGDINNYTVFYLTSSEPLARGLRRAGVDAKVDDDLVFKWTNAADGTHARLVDRNDDDAPPPFSIDSTVNIPTSATIPFDFVANWYVGHPHGNVLMHGTYPGILFGANSPNVVIHTPRHSGLGQLLGGTSATFQNLSVFNAIPTSHLHVAPSP